LRIAHERESGTVGPGPARPNRATDVTAKQRAVALGTKHPIHLEVNMVDIIHRMGIRAPLSKVYAALSTVEGIAGWWTRDTSGESRPGGNVKVVFRSRAGDEIGKMVFEVIELNPNKKVQWRFESGPEEWIGTDVTFTLSEAGDQTLISFGHRNWREAVEFTAHCSMKWATFLLSLKQLVETGKGRPAPDDLKIDDWN
jgi:uncharacterized protein YndB with AHSA1/START domain